MIDSEFFYVIPDKFPVTSGHLLIVSVDHYVDFFEMPQNQISFWQDAINLAKKYVLKQDALVDGFNLAMNCGESAGQTIRHFHTHLIPRRKKGVEA